jgi:hypothetical protein
MITIEAGAAPLQRLIPLALLPPPPRCPVWRNSTAGPIDWARPMSEPERKRWLRELHRFDDQTKRDRGPQGCIGRIGFDVVRALFFLQRPDGELAPSKASIASAAGICERTAHDALTRLKDRGVIGWARRCKPGVAFAWVQDTSAYFFRPPSEWRGYRAGVGPPLPLPEAWGACPPLPAAIDQWAELRREGASVKAQIAALTIDPSDRLAVALGGLRRAMDAGGKLCRDTNLHLLRRGGPPADWPPD